MAHSDYLSLLASLSPAAYWKHDETSGTTLADSSGNARHETTTGSPLLNQTSTIPDYSGPVVVMDGTNDTISVADAAVFDAVDTQGLTYHRWLKMDAAGAGDVLYIIADKTGTSNANKQWTIFWDNRTSQGSPKRLRMQWGYTAGTVVTMDWTGDAARDALLAGGMFTFVFHPSSIGYVYYNGELVASGSLTNYPSLAGNVGNTRTLQVGHINGTTFLFKGQMGAGALWPSQLEQADIEALYRAEVGESGSTSHAPIVEIVSDTDYDSFAGHIVAPNGDLLVAFRKGTAHTTATSTQGIYQTRSTDGGSTWGAPVKIISNDLSTQYMTAGLSVIGSDCYLVTWVRPLGGGASLPATAVKIFKSTDNGSTWTLATTVDLSAAFPNGAYTEGRLILHGGYYYLAAYGQTSATVNDYEAGIWRSSDLSSWSRVATFDAGVNGYTETDVTVIGSTLVAAIRHNAQEACYTSTSSDGVTWSSPALARKFAVSAPRLSPSGPRGRAYMVQRYHLNGRGYLASIDETGAVREVKRLSGVIMYGQAAMTAADTVSVAWAVEKDVNDGDIDRTVFTFSGYETPATVAAPALGLGVDVPDPTVSVVVAQSVAAPVLALGVDVLDPTVAASSLVDVAAPVLALGVDVLDPTVGVAVPAESVAAPVLALTVAVADPTVDAVATAAGVWRDPAVAVERWVSAPVIAPPSERVRWSESAVVSESMVFDPRPVATPPALEVAPIKRLGMRMPAMSTSYRHPVPFEGGFDIERADVGRLQTIIGGRNFTFVRDVPTTLDRFASEGPMCDTQATVRLPLDPWDELGEDDLAEIREDAQVDVILVRPDGSVEYKWEGFVSAHDDNTDESGEDYTVQCEGLFMQAAHWPWDPPVIAELRDVGHVVADALNSVPNRRWRKIPRVTTGIPTSERGQQGWSTWQYVQTVLGKAWTDDGRQWSLERVARRTYRIVLKASTVAPTWTVTKGAPGVGVSLRRDFSTRRDAIFARGYAPDGGYWCGRVFALDFDNPPRYPFNNTSLNITVGTRDRDTDTGNGVTLWQRRMRYLGYPVTVDGVMNSADTKWVYRIQRDKGITVDGSLGPQTWTATFEDNSHDADLTTYRVPLAFDGDVWPWTYTASGARTLKSDRDTSVILHAMPEVDWGTDIRKTSAIEPTRRMLERDGTPGWTGTVTLRSDPWETGSSRYDIREGHNLLILGHYGGTVVQVASADHQDDASVFTVDTKARDAMSLDAIRDRDREARRDAAGRGRTNDRSALNNAQVVQYESESKAGFISRTAVNGNSGLWSVRKAFVSQVGVAKVEFDALSPKAEMVVAIFNRPIRTSTLATLIGDPLASSDNWYENVELLKSKYGLMEVFGDPGNPGGYYPRQKGDGTLTGKLRDEAGLPYDSPYGGFVWVALFTSRSTWVEGRIYPAVPQ